LARGLLPTIKPGMLVLVDRGFISGALVQAIRARGAHVLGRLAQGVFTHKEQVLPDGSAPFHSGPAHLPGPVGSLAGARH